MSCKIPWSNEENHNMVSKKKSMRLSTLKNKSVRKVCYYNLAYAGIGSWF